MKLGAFFHPTGNHVASWLHPDARIDAGTNIEHYLELAKLAESGRFDLIFLADAAAVRHGNLSALKRWPQYMAYFEPTTLLSAMAVVTKHIGLVATATTSYNEPYNIARRYASLDHISHGRAGWNVVTSSNLNESRNFSRESHFEHSDRYARAKEFVDVVQGLWDSWDDDAFIRDRESATYFDPSKLHVLDHKGEHFSVRGPLNAARSPQGQPVIVQAGSSETGKEFAAAVAEIVFTPQTDLARAREFYRDLKGRMAKYGRSPDQLKIMPGLNPIVGATAAEAEEKHRFLQERIHPDVGKELLSPILGGIDLSGCDVDKPIPDHLLPSDTNASKSGLEELVRKTRIEGMTIREMYMEHAGARGQRTIKGTAREIAQDMEEWFREEAVDGFLIQPAYLPGGLKEFIDGVIPELQKKGLFRTEYEGTTLRESLGLKVPASRYAGRPPEEANRRI
jgi:alkanesulfonate monooxygenase